MANGGSIPAATGPGSRADEVSQFADGFELRFRRGGAKTAVGQDGPQELILGVVERA